MRSHRSLLHVNRAATSHGDRMTVVALAVSRARALGAAHSLTRTTGCAFPRSVLDNRRAAWFHERAVARGPLRERARHPSHAGSSPGHRELRTGRADMESL